MCVVVVVVCVVLVLVLVVALVLVFVVIIAAHRFVLHAPAIGRTAPVGVRGALTRSSSMVLAVRIPSPAPL